MLCIVCHGYRSDLSPHKNGLLFTAAQTFPEGGQLLPGVGQAVFGDLPFDYFPLRVRTASDNPGDIMTVEEMRLAGPIDAELVALVGCSTASGSLSGSDSFVSLAGQWLQIGASSVIASSWTVDLTYAREWLPRFLECWLELRQPKAIAFREALRKQLQTGSAPPVSLWGVFALHGDWV